MDRRTEIWAKAITYSIYWDNQDSQNRNTTQEMKCYVNNATDVQMWHRLVFPWIISGLWWKIERTFF
jgi:hypothetical protein